MSKYVDVYVMPVKKAKLDEYRLFAEASGKLWKQFGALEVVEVVAEDVKSGEQTSFPQAVQLEPDEIVVVSWISFRSREDRDRINPEVMKDPLFATMGPDTIPVNGKRMFWGGFDTLVQV
jgi:uncharacterized protein YbaA (DUF1428 family)